jgi:hypothetical protein
MYNKQFSRQQPKIVDKYVLKRNTAVFWAVAPCSLGKIYPRFIGTCSSHSFTLKLEAVILVNLHGVTSQRQKTEIFIFTTVEKS